MMWLDTKEEVDLDWFMEALENNEIQLVSKRNVITTRYAH